MKFTTGKKIRTATSHFFEESGLRQNKREKQHPFLVLRPTKTRMNVDVAFTAEELLALPENTRVIKQWRGSKRSDCYRFTVRDLKRHIADNPKTGSQKI